MLVFKPIFHGGQYSTHGEWFMSPYNDDTFKGSYIEVVFEYKHLYTWLSPGKDLVLNCLSFKITFHNVVQCFLCVLTSAFGVKSYLKSYFLDMIIPKVNLLHNKPIIK